MNPLIPTTISECREMAHTLVSAGMTDEREMAAAVERAGQLGCTVPAALEANLFAKIYAGAVRGIDAVMSIRLFGIFNGSIRAVREGPLALVIASGKLNPRDIDERIVLMSDLLVLDGISVADPAAKPRAPESERAAARLRWCGEVPDLDKLRALDRAATDRAALLEQNGRDDGRGYRAAICLVRRDASWHCNIVDIDHASERGLLTSEWWTKYQDDALRYAARQPLLHRVFGDVLAGLVADDDAPETPAAAQPGEVDDDEEGDEPDLRRGVAPA